MNLCDQTEAFKHKASLSLKQGTLNLIVKIIQKYKKTFFIYINTNLSSSKSILTNRFCFFLSPERISTLKKAFPEFPATSLFTATTN